MSAGWSAAEPGLELRQLVSRVCWRRPDTAPQLSCQEELGCYATNPLFRKRRPRVPERTDIQPIYSEAV